MSTIPPTRATYPKLADLLSYTRDSLPTCMGWADNFPRPRRDGPMRTLTSLGVVGLLATAALAQAPVKTDFATDPGRRPVEPITVTMLIGSTGRRPGSENQS